MTSELIVPPSTHWQDHEAQLNDKNANCHKEEFYGDVSKLNSENSQANGACNQANGTSYQANGASQHTLNNKYQANGDLNGANGNRSLANTEESSQKWEDHHVPLLSLDNKDMKRDESKSLLGNKRRSAITAKVIVKRLIVLLCCVAALVISVACAILIPIPASGTTIGNTSVSTSNTTDFEFFNDSLSTASYDYYSNSDMVSI